jgi:uncharacterized protein
MKSLIYDKATHFAKALQSKSKPRTRDVYELMVRAHEQGDARATYALASWYIHGSPFTKKDLKRAVELLEIAAAHEVREAIFNLARATEAGKGTPKSARKAYTLYVQAALLGDAQAMREVARMYAAGTGVPKSRALAEVWRKCARTLSTNTLGKTKS